MPDVVQVDGIGLKFILLEMRDSIRTYEVPEIHDTIINYHTPHIVRDCPKPIN